MEREPVVGTQAKKPILRVLAGETVSPQPIWLMRQAGRYLSEYRDLRAKAGDFMKLCFTPAYAAEVTLQPIHRFGFDGAILFSDILVIPHALGQKLWFAEGEGPKLSPLEPQALAKLDPGTALPNLAPIFETVSKVRANLPPSVTMLGFAGAPWTVANYMIAGGSSDESEHLRKFTYDHPQSLDALLEILIETTSAYLVEQVKAGAEALQIFESWAGTIPADQVGKYSLEPIRRIISLVREKCPGTPFIVFPRGAGLNYADYANTTGTNAVSVDYQTSLTKLRHEIRPGMGTQGNLDPIALSQGGPGLEQAIASILTQTKGQPHIFNLGHGIRQETPIVNVEQLIRSVRKAA
ncbi:MAG: uroporphyrinogen decarboxylase [Micropepsaceae bacterium]